MGLLSHTEGFGGEINRVLAGMEVGTLVDRKVARSFDGQQGFGMLTIDRECVKPEVVPILKGKFTFDGHTWEV